MLVDGLTEVGRLADCLTCCPMGGRGSGMPGRISTSHWLARRLRTIYFKMHFELSELVVVSLRSNSDEISLGIM